MNIKGLKTSSAMALATAVAACIGAPAHGAQAQQDLSYAAKFVCQEKEDDRFQLLSGRYGTVINIHNPHEVSVRFSKRAVVALTQRDPRGEISPFVNETLRPGEALGVDCEDIRQLYRPPKNGFIDGYLVLRVSTDAELDVSPELDVVGVYSAEAQVLENGEIGDVESIAVETFQPKRILRVNPILPDLTIRLTNPPTTVSCPSGQGSCRHKVEFDVINAGSVSVTTPFDVHVGTHNGLFDRVSLPGLNAGGVASMSVTLGPGSNCYDPNCKVTAQVDSGNVINESDEGNNTDTRVDEG